MNSLKTAWESLLLLANGHDSRRAAPRARVDHAKLQQIGVLVMAKRANLLPSVREPLDALKRSGLRLRQDVYEQILIDAGEQALGG